MDNTYENIENTTEYQETEETQTTEEIQYTNENVSLADIHNDLGIIACFLIFFTLVIILKYIYKFFNMIFQF